MIGEGLALEVMDTFLATPWGAERHGNRVAKITAIEQQYAKPDRRRSPDDDAARRPRPAHRGRHPRGAHGPFNRRHVRDLRRLVRRTLARQGPRRRHQRRLADRLPRPGRRRAAATWPATSITPCSGPTQPPPTSTSCATRRSSTGSQPCASTRPGCGGQPTGSGAAGGGRLGDRLPVRRRDQRDQGHGGPPGDPRRRPRDRHGHQHRSPQERRCDDAVREDIARGRRTPATRAGALNKVIIEAALLTDEEKVVACRLAQGGAGRLRQDLDRLRLRRGHRLRRGAHARDGRPRMGVKAAGGIRTAEDVQEMIAAGATRIGASAGVKIVTGERGAREQYRPSRLRLPRQPPGAVRGVPGHGRPGLPAAGRRRVALRRGLAGHRDQPPDRHRPQGDDGQARDADRRALLRAARGPLGVAGRGAGGRRGDPRARSASRSRSAQAAGPLEPDHSPDRRPPGPARSTGRATARC